jgi:hypothetical protein
MNMPFVRAKPVEYIHAGQQSRGQTCCEAAQKAKGGFQHWMHAATGPVSSHIAVCNKTAFISYLPCTVSLSLHAFACQHVQQLHGTSLHNCCTYSCIWC